MKNLRAGCRDATRREFDVKLHHFSVEWSFRVVIVGKLLILKHA